MPLFLQKLSRNLRIIQTWILWDREASSLKIYILWPRKMENISVKIVSIHHDVYDLCAISCLDIGVRKTEIHGNGKHFDAWKFVQNRVSFFLLRLLLCVYLYLIVIGIGKFNLEDKYLKIGVLWANICKNIEVIAIWKFKFLGWFRITRRVFNALLNGNVYKFNNKILNHDLTPVVLLRCKVP